METYIIDNNPKWADLDSSIPNNVAYGISIPVGVKEDGKVSYVQLDLLEASNLNLIGFNPLTTNIALKNMCELTNKVNFVKGVKYLFVETDLSLQGYLDMLNEIKAESYERSLAIKNGCFRSIETYNTYAKEKWDYKIYFLPGLGYIYNSYPDEINILSYILMDLIHLSKTTGIRIVTDIGIPNTEFGNELITLFSENLIELNELGVALKLTNCGTVSELVKVPRD